MSPARAHSTAAQPSGATVARGAEPPHSRRAMLLAPGRLELRDFDPPRPGPGEVLLQVRCALSCGTDLKAWRRGHPMWPMPTPLGHEFSGVVAEVGAGVSQFEVGDERFEYHWYEHPGVGKVEMKRKQVVQR